VGEGRNGEGQGKFNGKLDIVLKRTGCGVAKCVVRKKGNVDERKKIGKKERFKSVKACL